MHNAAVSSWMVQRKGIPATSSMPAGIVRRLTFESTPVLALYSEGSQAPRVSGPAAMASMYVQHMSGHDIAFEQHL